MRFLYIFVNLERPEITSIPLQKPTSYLIEKAQFGKRVVCSL